MQKLGRRLIGVVPQLGLISATCGILFVSQLSASASTKNNLGVNRVAKDLVSAVAAGVGASISAATYLPATITTGPTLASGIAGSAGFATGGATKVAGDYLVNHPKTSIRNVSATLITGDLISLPVNLMTIVNNLAQQIARRLFS